jgi:hypothetical protein
MGVYITMMCNIDHLQGRDKQLPAGNLVMAGLFGVINILKRVIGELLMS